MLSFLSLLLDSFLLIRVIYLFIILGHVFSSMKHLSISRRLIMGKRDRMSEQVRKRAQVRTDRSLFNTFISPPTGTQRDKKKLFCSKHWYTTWSFYPNPVPPSPCPHQSPHQIWCYMGTAKSLVTILPPLIATTPCWWCQLGDHQSLERKTHQNDHEPI